MAWSLRITQLWTAALPIYAYFIKHITSFSLNGICHYYYVAQSTTYSEILYGKSHHSEEHTHKHMQTHTISLSDI